MSKCLYKILLSISDPDFVKIDLPGVDWKVSQKTYCRLEGLPENLLFHVTDEHQTVFDIIQWNSIQI